MRFTLALAALALALLPPLVAPSIPVMCVLMLIAGLPIAPAFASSYGLVDELAVPGHDDRGVRAARHRDRRGPLARNLA